MTRISELSMKTAGSDKVEMMASSRFNPVILGLVVLILSTIGYFLVSRSFGASSDQPEIVTGTTQTVDTSGTPTVVDTPLSKPKPPLILVWLLTIAGVLGVVAVLAIFYAMPWWERRKGVPLEMVGVQSRPVLPMAVQTPVVQSPPTPAPILPDMLRNDGQGSATSGVAQFSGGGFQVGYPVTTKTADFSGVAAPGGAATPSMVPNNNAPIAPVSQALQSGVGGIAQINPAIDLHLPKTTLTGSISASAVVTPDQALPPANGLPGSNTVQTVAVPVSVSAPMVVETAAAVVPSVGK